MIDFMGKKKIWFAISLTIAIVGIVSLAVQGINFGIDYTGGTLIDLKFDNKISISEVRKTLEPAGYGDAKLQFVGDSGKEVLIRTKVMEEKERKELLSTIQEKLGKYQIMRVEKVSAVVGKELVMQAIYALIIASILMIIYISFRFEYRFAIAGIIGILHDLIVVVTFTSLFQIEVDSSFIAVILTVIGYSINDTIVVFDRIRENLPKMHHGDSYARMANQSINDTLTRCINTTGTTLVALFAIWIFAGATIKGFIFGLFIGIATGAYSSIFLCCPIWVIWKEHDSKNGKVAGGKTKGVPAKLKKA